MESIRIGKNLYNVEIIVGKSIRIYENDVIFKIGDKVQYRPIYDTYHVYDIGEIVKITEKRITIQQKGSSTTRNLGIFAFCNSNYNFKK